jgi:mxaK protein
MNNVLLIARWLLLAVIVASTALLLSSSYRLWIEEQVNAYLLEPESTEAVPDDPRARFAHAGVLNRQEKNNEALEELTGVLGEADLTLQSLTYFNRGNINLREALKLSSSDGRQIPLVELAKQDYRSALALDSSMWNARYNLEVALRVVPEDPDSNDEFEKNVISSQRSIESKAFKVDLP